LFFEGEIVGAGFDVRQGGVEGIGFAEMDRVSGCLRGYCEAGQSRQEIAAARVIEQTVLWGH
jgi:hypothetical protein